MKKASAVIVIIFLLLCVFTLCACNETKDADIYYVILLYANYNEETGMVDAQIGFTLNESESIGLTCKRDGFVERDTWFKYYKYNYKIEGDLYEKVVAASSELGISVPQNSLNVFYKYSTRYKSATSDGEIQKKDSKYIHTFTFKQGEEAQFNLSIRAERREVWYGVLIGAAGAVTAVVTLSLIGKKRNGGADNGKQKEQ